MPEAFAVHRALLARGPLNLEYAFRRPREDRRSALAEAARWFDLERNLRRAGVAVDPWSTPTEMWLQAIRHIADEFMPQAGLADELRAIASAWEATAATIDAERPDEEVPSADVWGSAHAQLRATSPRTTSRAALSGRHWIEIRRWLAEGLAAMSRTPSPHLRPRAPREPSGFTDANRAGLRADLERYGLVVIEDQPGSGKTEFVLGYLERSLQDQEYDHALWLRADHASRIEGDFLQAARILVPDPVRTDEDEDKDKDKDKDGDDEEVSAKEETEELARRGRLTDAERRRRAFEVLERGDRWLLVFDGVEGDPALLLPWIPRSPYGHVIITTTPAPRPPDAAPGADGESPTRLDRWGDLLNVLANKAKKEMPRLTVTEAADMLPSRPRPEDEEADEALGTLMEQTDRSRFAIALAGLYLEDQAAIDLKEFNTLYGERRTQLQALLDRDAGERAPAAPVRPGTVAASLMLDLLRTRGREGAEALELLNRLRWFSHGAIPGAALTHPHTPLDRPVDDARLALLEEVGLASAMRLLPAGASFEVHQDVHAAVALDADLARHLHESLAQAGSTALFRLTASHDDNLMAFEALPHVRRIAKSLFPIAGPDGVSERPLSAITLYARAAARYWERGFASAADLQIAKIKELFDERSVARVQAIVATGEDWSAMKDEWAKADNPPRLAGSGERLWSLVHLLRSQGHLAGSIAVYEELLNHLGEVLRTQSPFDRGRLLFEGGLSIRDRGGPGDASVPVVVSDDPDPLVWPDPGPGMADVERADKLFEMASAQWDAPPHADSDRVQRWMAAARMMNGVCASDRGDDAGAIRIHGDVVDLREHLHRRAVSRRDDAAARDLSGELARGYFSRGRAHLYLGHLPEAESDFAKATDHWDRFLGEPRAPHMNRASARSNHAVTRARMGVPRSAVEALSALREAEGVAGPDHPKTGLVRMEVAEVLARTAHEAAAVEEGQRAAWAIGRYWDRAHPLARRVRIAHAEVARAGGSLDLAARILVQGVLQPPMRGLGDPAPAELARSRDRVRARGWIALASVLLDHVADVEVGERRHQGAEHGGTSEDALVLDLVGSCLLRTNAATPLPVDAARVWDNPETVQRTLLAAEVALRQRRAITDALLRCLVEVGDGPPGVDDPATWPAVVAARAKLFRARLAAGEDLGREALLELKADVQWPDRPIRAAERLEVALAACAVYRREPAPKPSPEAAKKATNTALDVPRQDVSAAFDALDLPSDQPHQVRALGYSALAVVAEAWAQKRLPGRNRRERDRLRPMVSRDTLARIQAMLDDEKPPPTAG